MSTHCWLVSVYVEDDEHTLVMWREYRLPFSPLEYDIRISFCGLCCDPGAYTFEADDVEFDALKCQWLVSIKPATERYGSKSLDEALAHWSRAGFAIAEDSRRGKAKEVRRG